MSPQRWRSADPDRLPGEIADVLGSRPGTVRVAVDGPACARPEALADSLVEPLRALGRPAVHVRSRVFRRAASVRLEHGREDVDSFLLWLDHGALQREVLDAALERGEYLPSLRDPDTDRSTRATPQPIAPGTVVLVSGELLLGLGLAFEHVIHLQTSAAARARRTPADDAWTLPAFERYDAEVIPSDLADMVIRVDDPRHPAVRA